MTDLAEFDVYAVRFQRGGLQVFTWIGAACELGCQPGIEIDLEALPSTGRLVLKPKGVKPKDIEIAF